MKKTELKQYVVDGRTDKAIEALVDGTANDTDSHFHNQCIQLFLRWEANEEGNHLGTISPSVYKQEKNRINKATLVLVDKIAGQSKKGWSKWYKWAAIFAGILGALGATAEFSGYRLRDCWENTETPVENNDSIPSLGPVIHQETHGPNSDNFFVPNGPVIIDHDIDYEEAAKSQSQLPANQ